MNKNIKVKQLDKTDCAAACLASVASFWGLNLPLTQIREACGTGKDGTTLKGIIDAADKIGFSAKGFKSEEIKGINLFQIPKPAILHLQRPDGWLHFVVLYEINPKKATILDPDDGEIRKMSLEELEKQWSGYLVILEPAPKFQKGDYRTNLFAQFKELILMHRKELLPALYGSIVYILVGLSTSLFLQQIIDKVLPTKELPLLFLFAIIMALLMGLSLFIGYFRTILIIRAGIKIDGRLIMSYINHLLKLPLSFFNSRSTGELNSRIADAYKIRSFISEQLLVIFISIFSLLISFALLFTYYWKLALLVLLFVPLYIILYHISNKVNKRNNKSIIESAAQFEANNIETLSSIMSVKYFGSQERFSRKIESHYTDMANKLYKGGKNIALFSISSDVISKTLTLTILIVGSLFVFDSSLTIGELVSFYSITSFFTSPLITLVESNSSVTEAQIAARRLFEIIDLETEEDLKTFSIKSVNHNSRFLKVNNLSFSYPGRGKLIENLSFTIEKGKIIAIVGESGRGKSTIATLLMKGLIPDSGNIKFGEIDIKQIPHNDWRRIISIVPQKVELFNGSIIENIAPGDEEPDIENIMSVCHLVGANSIIDMIPEGVLGRVGEQGCNLSGGERQKIAFARALYRNSHFLILDEPTSYLDDESRDKMIRLIKSLALYEIGILLISHDKESIEIADNIIYLNTNAHSKGESRTPESAV